MKPVEGGVALDRLLLDPENPRLPEDLLGASQDEILSYLFENDVLEELAESMTLNGYFDNEQVIVLPPNSGGDRFVVEGNRRVATLHILNQSELAKAAGVRFSDDLVLSRPIVSIPAYQVADRDELDAYLGFRHINGVRTWGASEKARFVWGQVVKLGDRNVLDPFFAVGRAVGSNSRGVRTSYVSYALLKQPDVYEENKDAVEFVLRKRFGVWLRLLGTKNVPAQIGFNPSAKSYREVNTMIASTNKAKIVEVVRDLAPRREGSNPVLADSRSVTTYSDVIGYDPAYRVLRETGKLSLAKAIVDRSDFDKQLQAAVEQVGVLLELIATVEEMTPDSLPLAMRLNSASRSLLGAVRELSADDSADI